MLKYTIHMLESVHTVRGYMIGKGGKELLLMKGSDVVGIHMFECVLYVSVYIQYMDVGKELLLMKGSDVVGVEIYHTYV